MKPTLLLLPLLVLAGCGPRESEQQLATEDYCRQAANRVYNQQHREDLAQESEASSPLSSTGLPTDPSAGLSDRYELANRVDDCVSRRTSATEDGTTFGPQGPSQGTPAGIR